MKKVITYGTYDLFHEGHLNLLKSAKALGDYLIVGVTTDNFDLERGKMNTCNNIMERIEAVKATGLADQIIIEEYKGQKIDDIRKYDIDIFAIGSDWEGKFDYLKEYCEIVYLPRTEGISSTQLREEQLQIKLGIIGTGSIACRFIEEAKHVNSVKITSIYNPDIIKAKEFCNIFNLGAIDGSFDQLLERCDSIYVASPYQTHYDYCYTALTNNKNVLCETPFVLEEKQAKTLYDIAKKNHKVLMVALKTAYCPAFNHLYTLLKSGVIGDIVEINTSSTTIMDEITYLEQKRYGGSVIENASFTLLPIVKFLGNEFLNINFYSKYKNDIDIFTKGVMRYEHSVASFQVGIGVKTEGNLIISGTKGYAYVPAPWWKTDYFELRFEDQNNNKKYYYPYLGYGLRYEIKDFATAILSQNLSSYKLSKEDVITIAKIHDLYLKKKNLYHL